jgi:hypothetical protein
MPGLIEGISIRRTQSDNNSGAVVAQLEWTARGLWQGNDPNVKDVANMREAIANSCRANLMPNTAAMQRNIVMLKGQMKQGKRFPPSMKK